MTSVGKHGFVWTLAGIRNVTFEMFAADAGALPTPNTSNGRANRPASRTREWRKPMRLDMGGTPTSDRGAGRAWRGTHDGLVYEAGATDPALRPRPVLHGPPSAHGTICARYP